MDEMFIINDDLYRFLELFSSWATIDLLDLSDVPLDLCVLRDAARERTVGALTITRQYDTLMEQNTSLVLPDSLDILQVDRKYMEREWNAELQARRRGNESLALSSRT